MRRVCDRRLPVCQCLLVVLVLASGSFSAQAQSLTQPRVQPPAAGPSLTSPAVDRSLYREGAVRRLTGTFGPWTLVCDEVTRLKQRVCSLRTTAHAASGAAVANLTFSTGEDGRAAALMRIAADWVPGTWVEIVPQLQPAAGPPAPPSASTDARTSSAKSATKAPEALKSKPPFMKLRPVGCDGRHCTLIWSLPPAQIEALNTGVGLVVRYQRSAEGVAVARSAGHGGPVHVAGAIAAQGFSQAISAAIHTGK